MARTRSIDQGIVNKLREQLSCGSFVELAEKTGIPQNSLYTINRGDSGKGIRQAIKCLVAALDELPEQKRKKLSFR